MNIFEEKLNNVFEDVNKENLIDNAGNIDVTTIDDKGDIKIQWLRNAEAVPPQKFGNHEIIFPLTKETFEKYFKLADKKHAHKIIKSAKSYEELLNNFKKFLISEHNRTEEQADGILQNDIFVKLFRQYKGSKWTRWMAFSDEELPFVPSKLLDIYANQDVKWALQVLDFEDEEAKIWGSLADSEIYANINPQDKKRK